MEFLTENWQRLLVFVLLAILLTTMISAAAKERKRKLRESTRKLELVLQPRETIKVICPQKKGRAVLTSKRVLFETAQGFTAIDLNNIHRVQGNNEKGNRTTSIPKMVSLTIKAESDYTVKNNCAEFAEFAKQLIKETARKSRKKM